MSDEERAPSVTIVIVNYNGLDYIERAIASAVAQKYTGTFDIIVVDNASTDGSGAVLALDPRIRFMVSTRNGGFGYGINLAARSSAADFLALLNPDAFADPDWLQEMIPWMSAKGLDVASSIVRAGRSPWFAGGHYLPMLGVTAVARRPISRTRWISGCAMVVRRSAFERLDGFDERFFLYYEDVDFSLRAVRAGFRLGVLARSLVDHPAHGRSTSQIGTAKATHAYYSRGLIVGRYTPPALRFVALAIALLGALGRRDISWTRVPSVLRALLDGMHGAAAAIQTRPRVAVVANTFESGAGLRAGGHRHFIEVVRRWKDFELTVFAPELARSYIARELPAARFVSMPSLTRAGKAVDFFYRVLTAPLRWKAIRDADIVLATSHGLPDVMAALSARNVAIVIVHHLIERTATVRASRASLLPTIAERASLVLMRASSMSISAASTIVTRQLRAAGLRRIVGISTNGVDHLAIDVARESSTAVRRGAVFVGRLHPTKGVADAIEAWSDVHARFPDRILSVVGAPQMPAYAAELRRSTEERGLGTSVRFIGSMSDDELANLLVRSEVCVFPSYEEGWGIAIAEAMRAGLPCVTYDLPIFREIFPRGRRAVAIGDVRALAEQIVALFEDPVAREALAAEGLAYAQTLTWDRASVRALRGVVVALETRRDKGVRATSDNDGA